MAVPITSVMIRTPRKVLHSPATCAFGMTVLQCQIFEFFITPNGFHHIAAVLEVLQIWQDFRYWGVQNFW